MMVHHDFDEGGDSFEFILRRSSHAIRLSQKQLDKSGKVFLDVFHFTFIIPIAGEAEEEEDEDRLKGI